MNDPRRSTLLAGASGQPEIVSFEVNDMRALQDELETCQCSLDLMDGEQRAALIELVRDALVRLAEDPEEWLPDAVVARSDSKFGFFVLWENGHLDQEVLLQRNRALRETDAPL
jgi:hypothetical protein